MRLFRMLSLAAVSVSLLSGCFLNPGYWADLDDLQVTSAQLGGDCPTLPPPADGGFQCPFDKNPYLTTDTEFIGCIYDELLFQELEDLPDVLKGQTEAMLMQGYNDAKANMGELGMYGFRFQTPEQAMALEQAVKASTEGQNDIDVWQQGKLALIFWTNGGFQSGCLDNLQTLLKKRLGR